MLKLKEIVAGAVLLKVGMTIGARPKKTRKPSVVLKVVKKVVSEVISEKIGEVLYGDERYKPAHVDYNTRNVKMEDGDKCER